MMQRAINAAGWALGIITTVHSAAAQDCDVWTPIGDPGWRSNAAAAFDPQRGVVVMYGGDRRSGQSSGLFTFSETWEFDGRRWRFVPTAAAPTGRYGAVMAYIPASSQGGAGRLTLHGGRPVGASSTTTETWSFDGANWSLVATGGPAATSYFSVMTPDPAAPGAALVTVQDPTLPMRLWRLEGSTWTQIEPSEGQLWPGVNIGGLGQYDPLRARLVLFAYATGAVWEWDGATWSVIANAFAPTTQFTISNITSAPALGGVLITQNGAAKVWNGATFTPVGSPALPNGPSYTSVRGVTLLDGSPALLGDFVSASFSSGVNAAVVQVLKIGPAASQIVGSRPSPSSRAMYAFADYPGHGTMLVGGARDISGNCPSGTPGSIYFGDTWLLRGERWTRLATAGTGTPYNAPLVFDPLENSMVLPAHCSIRAGAVGAGGAVRSARWNGAAGGWEAWAFATSPSPAPSGYNSNTVDSATGRIWIASHQAFGLYQRSGMAWASLNQTQAQQVYGTITFDPVRNAVVRVGNNTGEPTMAFSLATGTWGMIQPYPSNPTVPYPGRWGPASVYDPGRQAMVVYGGFNSSDSAASGTFPGSTYFLPSAANAWQRVNTTNMPGREYFNLAYDPVAERIVTFGGHNFDYLGDTWKLARGPAGIAIPPSPQAADAGGSVSMEVVAKGGGAIRYQWRRNGVPLIDDSRTDGVHTDMLTIADLVTSDGGEYDVVVTNACGSETSTAARLEVFGAPCPADVGATGGVEGADGTLDNNDFIVFIDRFFAASPSADIGATGGVAGSDNAWDNNDFVVFIDQFFTPC